MALTKRTVVRAVQVEGDGQMTVFKHDEVWEGGFDTGTLEITGKSYSNSYDVGDAIPGTEDNLVKDVVNGNLHSQARKDARDAKKAERGG